MPRRGCHGGSVNLAGGQQGQEPWHSPARTPVPPGALTIGAGRQQRPQRLQLCPCHPQLRLVPCAWGGQGGGQGSPSLLPAPHGVRVPSPAALTQGGDGRQGGPQGQEGRQAHGQQSALHPAGRGRPGPEIQHCGETAEGSSAGADPDPPGPSTPGPPAPRRGAPGVEGEPRGPTLLTVRVADLQVLVQVRPLGGHPAAGRAHSRFLPEPCAWQPQRPKLPGKGRRQPGGHGAAWGATAQAGQGFPRPKGTDLHAGLVATSRLAAHGRPPHGATLHGGSLSPTPRPALAGGDPRVAPVGTHRAHVDGTGGRPQPCSAAGAAAHGGPLGAGCRQHPCPQGEQGQVPSMSPGGAGPRPRRAQGTLPSSITPRPARAASRPSSANPAPIPGLPLPQPWFCSRAHPHRSRVPLFALRRRIASGNPWQAAQMLRLASR